MENLKYSQMFFLILILFLRKCIGSKIDHLPSAIFVFGDSLSDTGNRIETFPFCTEAENSPYGSTFFHAPSGRFSDGRLIIDFMASKWDFGFIEPYFKNIAPNYQHGINFAVAGATAQNITEHVPFFLPLQTDHFIRFKRNVYASLNSIGKSDRIDPYLPRLEAFGDGIYMIFVGINDILLSLLTHNLTPSDTKENTVPLVVSAISKAMQDLHREGAKNFMVFNIPAIGCIPSVLSVGSQGPFNSTDRLGCLLEYNEAGESYAGVYVPTLAFEVAKGIDAGLKPTLNFKGYMVGNGVTDNEFDGNALVPFAHGMGLISDQLFQEVNTACQGSYWIPVNKNCENSLDKVDNDISGLNIYDILEPCYHSPKAREIAASNIRLPTSFKQIGDTDRPLSVRKRMFGRAWPLRAPVRDGIVPTWPELMNSESVPCTDDEIATSWLNNEAVRKALHAKQENLTWELCTGKIRYFHNAGSMITYHKNLTSRGYQALIYSGDHDMCVPYTGSEAWTRSLGYKIVDEWRPWYSGGQVAGYIQGYENHLTFLTIKGSGHTVPEYKPQEALTFYTHWLAGEKI